MIWTKLSLLTPVPQIPLITNNNFASFERYINTFYDGSIGILTVPLETAGRVKGARGEFVTAVVDNLVVKKQFTNLYDNNNTADYDFYRMYVDTANLGRDACTASTYWPQEDPYFTYIDVQKPYYKISNVKPVAFNTTNLSQVVGVFFDSSTIGGSDFEILLDPCTYANYIVDASNAGRAYMEFIATGYDPSWGTFWKQYKYGADDSSTGSGGYGEVGPGTIGYIPVFDGVYSIADSPFRVAGNALIIDGSIMLNGEEVGPKSYDPILSDDVKMPTAVGGIPADTSVAYLRGKSYDEMFSELLFPTAYPTLTAPSLISFNVVPASGLATFQEIGSVISINVSASFSRGSISPQYSAASPYRSGTPNTYEYTGYGLISYASTSTSDSRTITGYTVTQGNQTGWSCRVLYNAGVQPYDSKGNMYNSPLPSGNSNTIFKTFEGVYPIFATTVSISNPDTKQALVSMLTGQYAPSSSGLALVAEDTTHKQSFDMPMAWVLSRPIVNIQTYNPTFATWSDSGFAEWTTSTVYHTIGGISIPYRRYTYNGAQRAATTIRLRFS